MPNWKTYESSVRLLSAILAAHPDLKLNYSEIARAFGGDCTRWAIDNRFRSLKTDAKKIVDALATGIDPITLAIPSGVKGRNPCTTTLSFVSIPSVSSHCTISHTQPQCFFLNFVTEIAAYYGDCTEYALDHRFRKIKKSAKEMRAERGVNSIAEKYEEGVTAKAVSTRFERLKKEPDWLGNNANGGAPRSSGPRAPRTPKKKVTKKEASDDDNEDDEEAEISPSKFTPKGGLNKTMGGRVAKARTPRKAAAAIPTYVESGGEQEDDDDEDGHTDEYTEEKNVSSMVVKSEMNDYGAATPNNYGAATPNFAAADNAGGSFSTSFPNSFSNGFVNGISNGHSNGHSNGYGAEDHDEFHEAHDNQFGNGYDDDAV